jgi:hypothetical protein
VFHRKNGKRIKYWRRQWLQALLKVGLAHVEETSEQGQSKKKREKKIIPHVMVHDFRRGAIRNLDRAGVSQTVGINL